jgi:hypothetical protein
MAEYPKRITGVVLQMLPAGTDRLVVKQVRDECRAALKRPNGAEVSSLTSEQTAVIADIVTKHLRALKGKS